MSTPSSDRVIIRPGPDFVYDAASNTYKVEASRRAEGVDLSMTLPSTDGAAGGSYRLTFAYESTDPVPPSDPTAVSIFGNEAAIGDLGFIYPAKHAGWKFNANGFGRLQTPTRNPALGAWTKAKGDGVYRTLFRLLGATLPPSSARRFVFGGRVRIEGDNWYGVRVDVFDNAGPKLQINDYTGQGRQTAVIATTAVEWKLGVWYWLDVSLQGETVKARIYVQNDAAPDWQISGQTASTGSGAFGPGGMPALDVSPVIDISRLEFIPA